MFNWVFRATAAQGKFVDKSSRVDCVHFTHRRGSRNDVVNWKPMGFLWVGGGGMFNHAGSYIVLECQNAQHLSTERHVKVFNLSIESTWRVPLTRPCNSWFLSNRAVPGAGPLNPQDKSIVSILTERDSKEEKALPFHISWFSCHTQSSYFVPISYPRHTKLTSMC